jgi:hypothetical protein
VRPRPKGSRLLYRALPGHSEHAARATAPAAALVGIEGYEVKVWVPGIVAGLVVDRHDIARGALRQRLRERARKLYALLGRRLHGERHDEPLGYAPAAFLCCLFSSSGGGRVVAFEPLPDHLARCSRAGDVAQMGGGLPRNRRPLVGRALGGERLD